MKLMLKWGLLAAVLTVLVGSSPANALYSGNIGTASKCIAGKAKCVIKKKACLLGCYKKKVAKAPFTLPVGCVEKCRIKFDGGLPLPNAEDGDPAKGCFAKLEAKIPSDCGASVGDTSVFEAKIDAHVLDLVSEIDLVGANVTTGKCTSGKIGCALKFNSCILGLVSKGAGAGGPIDPVKRDKCRTSLASCIGKLDVKGDTDLDGVSNPGCQTNKDAEQIRIKDEAFIDDVIAELVTGPNDMNTQRCNGNPQVKCTTAPGGVGGCGGPLGTCEYFFGSHLPLSSGGVATCVRSQWTGGITGTFNQQTGESSGTANILSTVYSGISSGQPCPRCDNDPFINDGSATGTCTGGTRNGLACDGNGQSPETTFGVTSLDCPPGGGPIAAIPIDLTNTTGTVTKTLAAAGPNCSGTPGDECMCGVCTGDNSRPCFDTATGCTPFAAGTCTNVGIGEPEKTNPCIDETYGGDGTLCSVGANGEGFCPEGPFTSRCILESYRTCTVPNQAVDCPAAGDLCGPGFPRECFPGYNGVVGNTISATGDTPVDPRNHSGVQEFASVFCIAATSAPAVNTVAGLPGPGRLTLGGVGQENGTGGACPTQAAFLPTYRGGVLDTGWTGIAHDAKALSGGKVTVSVSGCTLGVPDANGNCGVCTYSGPIANANANP